MYHVRTVDIRQLSDIMHLENSIWPVGQAVKTAASHAANMGSIPVRVTREKQTERSLQLDIGFSR